MLLYLACLWRWSIASAGDDEDIRQSECGVARLSSCLRDTSISCMLWFLVVGSLSWGLFREASLNVEKFGADELLFFFLAAVCDAVAARAWHPGEVLGHAFPNGVLVQPKASSTMMPQKAIFQTR